ncbi:MAG TPA: energy transducer TonB [Pyrinomonadaceae bacterium]|nr:energy transducer TonB [Pyrinomonadaceae bacterium]
MQKTQWFAAGLILACISSVLAAPTVDIKTSERQNEKVYKSTEVSRKVTLTAKPEAEYTEDARENKIEGNVILHMVLRSNGEVSDIAVLKGLPHGLNDKAIEAARNIKFEPAIKDGHPVSQYLRVEYVFTL